MEKNYEKEISDLKSRIGKLKQEQAFIIKKEVPDITDKCIKPYGTVWYKIKSIDHAEKRDGGVWVLHVRVIRIKKNNEMDISIDTNHSDQLTYPYCMKSELTEEQFKSVFDDAIKWVI